MILKSIEKSAKEIIFNPLILLPFLLIGIFGIFLDNFIGIILERPLIDLFFYGNTIVQENFGFILLTQYPIEIISLIIIGMIMVALSIVAWTILSRVSNEKDFLDAVNESVLDIRNAFVTSINLYIIGFVFLFIIFLITFIGALTNILGELVYVFVNGIIIPLIFIIAFIFLAAKFVFIFATITETKGKEVFEKSVEFSNGKTLSISILLILTFIIALIILSIFNYLSTLLLDFDIIILLIGETIAHSFIALTFSYYYFLQ